MRRWFKPQGARPAYSIETMGVPSRGWRGNEVIGREQPPTYVRLIWIDTLYIPPEMEQERMTFHGYECMRYTKDLDESYVCVTDTLLASYILLRKLRGCQSGVPGGWGEKWVCKMAVGKQRKRRESWG